MGIARRRASQARNRSAQGHRAVLEHGDQIGGLRGSEVAADLGLPTEVRGVDGGGRLHDTVEDDGELAAVMVRGVLVEEAGAGGREGEARDDGRDAVLALGDDDRPCHSGGVDAVLDDGAGLLKDLGRDGLVFRGDQLVRRACPVPGRLVCSFRQQRLDRLAP